MISGHFATALVAKTEAPKGSIWLYLIAAQSLDILMITFVFLGFEHLDLGSSIFPAMGSAFVDMRYSHDLIPVIGWTVVMGVIGYALTKNRIVALWCAGLAIVHELCDLVTGYPHNLHGPETAEFGMKLWVTSPVLATFIEAGFGMACVAWYLHKHDLPQSSQYALYLILGLTPFLLLPLVMR